MPCNRFLTMYSEGTQCDYIQNCNEIEEYSFYLLKGGCSIYIPEDSDRLKRRYLVSARMRVVKKLIM